MKLTIRDIAKMAGVSPATVSKVINNYEGIGIETKNKVLSIIQETGYRPTFSAKTLATKKSYLIGLVYAGKEEVGLNHPFFNEVINAFKKVIGAMGYDLLVFSNERFESEDYLARCRYFGVDGCLIITGDEIKPSIYDLVQSNVPCVGVDIELNGTKSSYIATDNTKISFQVVEHFYINSIRSIAYVGGTKEAYVEKLRKDGFIKAMKQFNLQIKNEWIVRGDFTEKGAYEATKKILSLEPYP